MLSTKNYIIFMLILLFGISSSAISAEEAEAEPEEKEALIYFEVEPNILTFYQGTGKKLGYVVVQVNIAVRGQSNYDLVELHLPIIQDNLIDFFNQQDKSVIQPFEQREQLRVKAMESVATALKEETGLDVVDNLLFTNYVYQ